MRTLLTNLYTPFKRSYASRNKLSTDDILWAGSNPMGKREGVDRSRLERGKRKDDHAKQRLEASWMAEGCC